MREPVFFNVRNANLSVRKNLISFIFFLIAMILSIFAIICHNWEVLNFSFFSWFGILISVDLKKFWFKNSLHVIIVVVFSIPILPYLFLVNITSNDWYSPFGYRNVFGHFIIIYTTTFILVDKFSMKRGIFYSIIFQIFYELLEYFSFTTSYFPSLQYTNFDFYIDVVFDICGYVAFFLLDLFIKRRINVGTINR